MQHLIAFEKSCVDNEEEFDAFGENMKIFKYPLKLTENAIAIPRGARPLTVQVQNGVVCLWAMIDENEPTEIRTIVICNTGEYIQPFGWLYLGTVQINNYVGHVFLQSK